MAKGRTTDTDLDVIQDSRQTGQVKVTDVDVLHPTGQKGRLTDTDVDVILPEDQRGRLTYLDIDVLQDDSASIPEIIAIGPGGWGFIPIGTFVDRSVYVDTYEDGY